MSAMEKHAFTMTLNPGMEAEYLQRHDEIWPELVDLLHEAGVSRLFDPSRPRHQHALRRVDPPR